MPDTYHFEIIVSGDHFDLGHVSLSQIGDLLRAVEQAVVPVAIRDNPDLALKEENVVLSLQAMTRGSLKSVLTTQYGDAVQRAVVQVSEAITQERYDALPLASIEGLKTIIQFNRRHNSDTEIWQHDGERARLAILTQTTRIPTYSHRLKNKTTLYGILMRIGGNNPARAKLYFTDGTEMNCTVKNISIAKQMAPLLYQRIGVRGTAHYDARDMRLHAFHIEALTPYRQKGLREAFDRLHEVIGPHLDPNTPDVGDIRGIDDSE